MRTVVVVLRMPCSQSKAAVLSRMGNGRCAPALKRVKLSYVFLAKCWLSECSSVCACVCVPLLVCVCLPLKRQ